MNIFITGVNGFLGKSFLESFSSRFFICAEDEINVLAPTHKELDLTSFEQIKRYFNSHNIDFVIHCAVSGLGSGNYSDFLDNLQMYRNLKSLSDKYRLMINLCSGAAFDRKVHIRGCSTKDLFERAPTDFYGLAKNIIAKDIIATQMKIKTLRLFGCFGRHEVSTRFIKQSLVKVTAGEPVVFFEKERLMDFFSFEDLFSVVKNILFKKSSPSDNFLRRSNSELFSLPKDMNLVYSEKITLEDVARMVAAACEVEYNFVYSLKRGASAKDYTGDGTVLEEAKIPLQGIRSGILSMKKDMENPPWAQF